MARYAQKPLTVPEMPDGIGIETIDGLRGAHHRAVAQFRFGRVTSSGYELMEDLARGEVTPKSDKDLGLTRSVEYILTEAMLLAAVDALYNEGQYGCPIFRVEYDGDTANSRTSADLQFHAEFEGQKLFAHVRYVPKRPPEGGVDIMNIRHELSGVANIKFVVANRNAASPTFAPSPHRAETILLVNLQTGSVQQY